MAEHRIRWNRSDYARLGRAISDFNKKIKRLQAEEQRTYLPKELNYKEVKENIMTRNRLNQVINSLRRFKRENAEELVQNSEGQQMTRWENRENILNKRNAKLRIRARIRELAEGREEYGGFSRIQMGSEEYNKLLKTLETFDTLDNLKRKWLSKSSWKN